MNLTGFIKKYTGSLIIYMVVGGFCALINWSAFYLLHYRAGLHYLPAGAVAFIISGTVNYFLCLKVFNSRGRKKGTEYIMTLAASLIALTVDLTVMTLLIKYAGIPAMLAKILGTGSAFVINYTLRQFFIFSPEPKKFVKP